MPLIVKCHHWQAAKHWATLNGSPEKVANSLISSWRAPPSDDEGSSYNFVTYPQTSEFRNGLALLIRKARENYSSIPIVSDETPDDLCRVCRACKRCS